MVLRGGKRGQEGGGGLYYMEDFTVGRAHHMHLPSDLKVEQILLWHRWLGHPSFGYLQHVFPNLFCHFSILNVRLAF